MNKTFIAVIAGLVFVSIAAGGMVFAAQKKMRGFVVHPEQKPIPVEKVKDSWAKLTKGKQGWNLYTLKNVDLVGGNMMKVILTDETGLEHELVLTQPQWLGMTEALVETTAGVMVGAEEQGNEIIAFAAPIRHW